MNKKTKQWFVAVVVVVLVIGIVQYLGKSVNNINIPSVSVRSLPKEENTTVSQIPQTKTELVTIDFGNGKKITGEVSTQSAYQALLQVAKANNLEISTKRYKFGVMVEKVGETGMSPSYFWSYSVNGKPGQIAADRFVINPGDKVEWVYTKMQK